MDTEIRYVTVKRKDHPGDYARKVISFIRSRGSVTPDELCSQYHWPKPYAEYAINKLKDQGYIKEL